MSQENRLAGPALIDRSLPINFHFDGAEYHGYRGDTVASALLANGVDVVGYGIDSGRPRGVFSAGVEEPSAMLAVDAPFQATLIRATQLELTDGLRVSSLRGRGRLGWVESGRYDKRHVHCDVLIVGAGPAGLSAAVAAAATGARVILADEGITLGGTLRDWPTIMDGEPASAWLTTVERELSSYPETRVLTRATAVGCFDHNLVLIAQRAPSRGTSERLWHVRAREVVIATGAHERSLVFSGNDRPGVMLAGAVLTYIHRYAVRPGRRAVIFANNDAGLAAAEDLRLAGTEVAEVADLRIGQAVVETFGDHRLTGALFRNRGQSHQARRVDCDLLVVSGGWNPAVELFSQAGGRLLFEASIAAFVPDQAPARIRVAGAVTGNFTLDRALKDGWNAGRAAARVTGFKGEPAIRRPRVVAVPVGEIGPSRARRMDEDAQPAEMTEYVDLEREVTVADIGRSVRAGFRSIEHIKRFTSLGTGSDQGKTSWTTAAEIICEALGQPPGSLGLPTFRPPYTPLSFALVAGRERGELYDPIRSTPMHAWHAENGAAFEISGQWQRPRYYPRAGESMDESVLRECHSVRTGVGMIDVSTLGKIDIQGPDAAEFLDRVYTNTFSSLAVGSCRYGLMCRLDGMVFDDGVTSRMAADRFHMTTTTGNAAAVLDHLEEWLQTEWPSLRAWCTSVTEQWAVVALVGPLSRKVLSKVAPGFDTSDRAFPFMTWRDAVIGSIEARIFRISFSGELAYEINVAAWHGLAMWEMLLAAGRDHGLTAYGTEALHVLRAEKGYPIIGQETDGSVTPDDLGLGRMMSRSKDFIGRRSQTRAELRRVDRKQLVGLLPIDPTQLLPEGAQLVEDVEAPPPVPMVGHVTSSYRSAALGRTFALGLVRRGRERVGQHLFAPIGGSSIEAVVVKPLFYDPDGLHRDG